VAEGEGQQMSRKKQLKTFVTPELVCPFCRHKMDRSTEAESYGDNVPPKPGDVSLCVRCGCAGVFTDKGALRKPTWEEMLELTANKAVTEGQIFIRSIS
jgi:hypothetical protein